MMTELEKILCEKFGAEYGVFTGNGTTAMYLAFKALSIQSKKVIFPAVSCTNPVNAAIYAGYTVDFCDVSLDDFTIDLCYLERMLETKEYGIVVPTNIYGHRYDEKKTRELCKKYNVVLMEDAAQSYYIGDMDISIMSFGHTKVCDTNCGGGIAFTNSQSMWEKMQIEKKKVPLIENSYDQILQSYRKKYYAIVKNTKNWNERNTQLKKLQLENKDYFIFDMDDNIEIYEKIKILDEYVKDREDKTKIYDQYLNSKYIIKPEVEDLYRWRYSFLYKGDRELLLKKARCNGIDISSWYCSLAGIYKNEHLKNADIIEKQIVNLWVDETHTRDQIKKDINVLNDIMENEHGEK